MDHEELIRELPIIVQNMTPAERIQLARERRAIQLQKQAERERMEGAPREKTQRVRFRPEIALLEATSRNDVDEVRRLLLEGAYPNSHNEDGLTPLHQCAIDNNESILNLLLEFGADVNAQDTEQWTPLHAAACCAHKNIVTQLIKNNANLMSVNADGNMPYDICDEDETLDLIESEMARQGITQDEIDAERGSPERKMLHDMKLLHQNQQALDFRDDDGATALHVAAAHGYYDVAAFLLRCNVSPNVRDNDLWQPMHAAACWAQADIIELLAEYGGDVNAKTNTGETPIDLCEDESTRAVIATLQAEAARRKRIAFGARDSRRQSRKKKAFSKFESPQQPQSDSPFSARGAIRRLSLRDKSGISLARIEARKEGSDLMRSYSLDDDLAANADGKRSGDDASKGGVSTRDIHMYPNGSRGNQPTSPTKKQHVRGGGKKTPSQGDEWSASAGASNDGDSQPGEMRRVTGGGGRRRGKKGSGTPTAPEPMDSSPDKEMLPLNSIHNGNNDQKKVYRAPKDTVVGDNDSRCHKCCALM